MSPLALPRVTALLLAFAVADLAPVHAQGSGLERVEELVRLGRAEEARGLLLAWWGGASAGASRRDLQRGLWLRARLTVDPGQAELDFQRLVVLYPRGDFTAQAIFRLAQLAYEMGDAERARGHVATLARDYGDSEERREAEAWMVRNGPAPAAPGGGPTRIEARPTVPDTARVTPDANRGAPDAGRAAADTSRAASPPDTARAQGGPAGATPEVGAYFVQLGAFTEEARALALHEEVRARGVEVRVVRVDGSRFHHVRFGRFVERADAVEELERLAAAGIGAALVRDERAEILVRN